MPKKYCFFESCEEFPCTYLEIFDTTLPPWQLKCSTYRVIKEQENDGVYDIIENLEDEITKL